MNSLGNLTERDFKTLVLAASKTLPYEGFSLMESLVTLKPNSPISDGALFLVEVTKLESEKITISLYLHQTNFKTLTSSGKSLNSKILNVLSEFNEAAAIRWITKQPLVRAEASLGDIVDLGGFFEVTLPNNGDVDSLILLAVTSEWQLLNWEFGK